MAKATGARVVGPGEGETLSGRAGGYVLEMVVLYRRTLRRWHPDAARWRTP